MFVCVFASFRLASLPDMLLYLFFIQTLNLLTSTTTFSNCIPTSYRLPFLRDSRSFVRSCRFTPIHSEFIMCQCICRLNRVFLLTACFSSGLGRCICVHHHSIGNFLPLRLRWATLVPFIYSLAWCICVRMCVCVYVPVYQRHFIVIYLPLFLCSTNSIPTWTCTHTPIHSNTDRYSSGGEAYLVSVRSASFSWCLAFVLRGVEFQDIFWFYSVAIYIFSVYFNSLWVLR